MVKTIIDNIYKETVRTSRKEAEAVISTHVGQAEKQEEKVTALQEKLDYLAKLIPQQYFDNLLKFALYVRPTVAGLPNYLPLVPFQHQIYLDEHDWVQVLWARQMWKSNYIGIRLAKTMVRQPGVQVLYGTYEPESLKVFSTKFRYELFNASPVLRQFIRGSTLGSVTKMELLTDSLAWLITHAHAFTHAEGKSTADNAIDEAQYIDWESYYKAQQAQSFTNGKFLAAGIGGDEGTPYHTMWLTTNQQEWIPDNTDTYVDSAGQEFPGQGWRKGLQFDHNKKIGNRLIWGDYLIKDHIVTGHWNATRPENYSRHGYHISQEMAMWIPLSKADAVNLYGVAESKSLEGQREDPNISQSDYIKNALAGFAQGNTKPFPRDLLYKTFDKNLSFLLPRDVDYELGKLVQGVDWGGGNRTVQWIYQVTNEQIPVFRLIAVRKLSTKDVHEQYNQVVEWIDDYSISQTMVDGGGGTHQVQELEKRYGNNVMKFFYLKRPGEPTAKNSDEEHTWKSQNMWQYDKTWVMERTKDYIARPFQHGEQFVKKIVWPSKDASKLEWILDQWGYETTEKIKLSAGQYYTRYFTPDPDKKPDDSLHAQNLAITAFDMIRGRGGKHIAGTMFDDTNSSSSSNLSSGTTGISATYDERSMYGSHEELD